MASSGFCALAMSSISTDIMEAIRTTWEIYANLRAIIQELLKDPATHPRYQEVNNHLNKKGKIVEGHKPTLQDNLIALNRDTAMGGHSGALVTAKRVGGSFPLEASTKTD